MLFVQQLRHLRFADAQDLARARDFVTALPLRSAIDPNAGTVSPQQYELRVQRLDLRFGQKIRELHRAVLKAGKCAGRRR
jgi:hypothetical protein